MDQLIQFFFKHKWSIFAKGQFGFANRPSWLLLALGAAAVRLIVYFLYVRPGYRINSKSKFGLIGLRAALLALLLILLMRPVVVVLSIIPASVAVIVETIRAACGSTTKTGAAALSRQRDSLDRPSIRPRPGREVQGQSLRLFVRRVEGQRRGRTEGRRRGDGHRQRFARNCQ